MPKLTAKAVAAMKTPGMHADTDGLYLHVSSSGAKSWIVRVTIKGERTESGKNPKRVEIGLGPVSALSLADAREKARVLRAEGLVGRNPLALRDRDLITFEKAARKLHASIAKTFRSEKHAKQWISGLENHVFPRIGGAKIETISRDQVLTILSPLWVEKHSTAKRLRQRIEAVFDWAIGNGFHPGPNPVDGALRRALPKAAVKPKHHAALPWRQVPAFMAELGQREAIAARAFEFAVLTATRSGETRGAEWSEIDLDRRVWVIPADRMKASEEHRVPLSDEAVTVLEAVQGLDARIVFPSPGGKGKPLSVNAFRPLLARMGHEGLTLHGFRSSFRDWCAESAHADRAVAEAALAHRVAGVEAAYFRSDLFERRSDLMAAWGRFTAGLAGDVVELVRA